MVYGNQLLYFAEQFRMFDYYTMKPQVNAGYTKREFLGKIKGVFQFAKKGDLLQEEDTLAETNVPTFWTRTKLKVGNFIVKDEETYRIKSPSDWSFEGGFYSYVLETVVGSTDEQKPHPFVDLGQNSYD